MDARLRETWRRYRREGDPALGEQVLEAVRRLWGRSAARELVLERLDELGVTVEALRRRHHALSTRRHELWRRRGQRPVATADLDALEAELKLLPVVAGHMSVLLELAAEGWPSWVEPRDVARALQTIEGQAAGLRGGS